MSFRSSCPPLPSLLHPSLLLPLPPFAPYSPLSFLPLPLRSLLPFTLPFSPQSDRGHHRGDVILNELGHVCRCLWLWVLLFLAAFPFKSKELRTSTARWEPVGSLTRHLEKAALTVTRNRPCQFQRSLQIPYEWRSAQGVAYVCRS